MQVLAEGFGLTVLSAPLEVLLGCSKHPRVLGKFVVRNARSDKLPKMGGHVHGDPMNGTYRLVEGRSGAEVDTGQFSRFRAFEWCYSELRRSLLWLGMLNSCFLLLRIERI